MWDFSIGRTLGLMGQTLPFLLFRVIVYFGIAVAFVLVTGVGAGVGWGIGAFGDIDFRAGSTAWGGIIGFGLVAGTLFFLREYILYMVKAGHIAVLVELLDGRTIPNGKSQIDYATTVVKQHFATSSMLFGLNQLIRGILRVFNRLTVSIASWLPIPGLDAVVKLVDAVINTSLSHLDQVILAQILRSKEAAAMIRRVGAEHIVMGTDCGQTSNVYPTDCLVLAARGLRAQGITAREIDLMYKINPAKLLGLPPPESTASR